MIQLLGVRQSTKVVLCGQHEPKHRYSRYQQCFSGVESSCPCYCSPRFLISYEGSTPCLAMPFWDSKKRTNWELPVTYFLTTDAVVNPQRGHVRSKPWPMKQRGNNSLHTASLLLRIHGRGRLSGDMEENTHLALPWEVQVTDFIEKYLCSHDGNLSMTVDRCKSQFRQPLSNIQVTRLSRQVRNSEHIPVFSDRSLGPDLHFWEVIISCIRKQAEQTTESKPVSSIHPGPLSQLPLWLPQWWAGVWKCKPNKPFPFQTAFPPNVLSQQWKTDEDGPITLQRGLC